MIRIADATFDDLTFIGSWLSDDDRRELAVTRDPTTTRAWRATPCSRRLCKVALDHAGGPVFAFGAQPIAHTDMAQVWGFKCERGWPAILTVTKYIQQDYDPGIARLRHTPCRLHRTSGKHTVAALAATPGLPGQGHAWGWHPQPGHDPHAA